MIYYANMCTKAEIVITNNVLDNDNNSVIKLSYYPQKAPTCILIV